MVTVLLGLWWATWALAGEGPAGPPASEAVGPCGPVVTDEAPVVRLSKTGRAYMGSGLVDTEAIFEAARAETEGLAACVRDELARGREIAPEPRLQVEIRFQPGAPRQVLLPTVPLASACLAGCVRREVARWPLPDPAAEAPVSALGAVSGRESSPNVVQVFYDVTLEPPVSFRLERPQVEGPDASRYARVLRAHHRLLEHCVLSQAWPKGDGERRVVLELQVEPGGGVTDVQAAFEGLERVEAIESCLVPAAGRWRFPPFEGDASVRVRASWGLLPE